ncbi:IS66 family transposase [Paenibacillus apiarius]|uniref:IS66 family transposase n=1 Tax=Paenibacillus apiarius TaxID=46240 RepID=UPI001F096F89|nr:IS66 family transposase [Paenibacillus apiarius]
MRRLWLFALELHAGLDPKLLREAVQALERYRQRKTKRKLRPSKGFSSATSNRTGSEGRIARIEHSRPILDAYLAWLRQQRSRIAPKSQLGETITCSLL